jgi:hypothetical protein
MLHEDKIVVKLPLNLGTDSLLLGNLAQGNSTVTKNQKKDLMMKKGNRHILFVVLLLLLLSLSCNLSPNLPFAGSQEEGISQEDVSIAATRAAEAAAAAEEAGQMAATAIAPVEENPDTALPTVEAPVTGSSLERKLANIQPDANGNFSVSITEGDLNEFVAGQEGGFQTEALDAQNIGFEITTEYLELTADVNEPVELPLIVRLRPAVVNDQLRFELISASAGLLPVPEGMLEVIETVANNELSRALIGLPTGIALTDATLANGEFTVFGHEN